MRTVETSTDLQQWIDRQAITDLIYRYSDAVTRGDAAQLESVFTDESILEIGEPFNLRHVGIDSIRELVVGGSASLDFLVQTASNPVIRLLGADRARATTTIYEMVRGPSNADTGLGDAGTAMNVAQYGVYFDDIVKIEGEWKFAHKLFRAVYCEIDRLDGTVLAPRAELMRAD
jgi:hypothetical protein